LNQQATLNRNSQILRDLARLVRDDRQQTLAMLADRFHVHRNTIRTYIRKLGFRNRIDRQKPYLTIAHKAKRLTFAKPNCKEHRHWTENDWKNVIWTDESSFERGKMSRHIRVWRKLHEAYTSKCLAPTFKSCRSLMMFWGAFTGFDKSPLVLMPEGERTTKDFIQNVYEGTLSAFYFMHDHPHHLTLMEDGAPVHRSNLAQQWRIAYGTQKLEWPPNSLDLNPIENLWKLVKDLLRHHNRPRSIQEMMQTIKAVWNEVSHCKYAQTNRSKHFSKGWKHQMVDSM
jgi:transposase